MKIKLLMALGCAPLLSTTLQAAQPSPPQVINGAAPVPAVRLPSAFDAYRAYRPQGLDSWSALNAAVSEAEAHAGHGPEAPTTARPPEPKR